MADKKQQGSLEQGEAQKVDDVKAKVVKPSAFLEKTGIIPVRGQSIPFSRN